MIYELTYRGVHYTFDTENPQVNIHNPIGKPQNKLKHVVESSLYRLVPFPLKYLLEEKAATYSISNEEFKCLRKNQL